MTNKLKLLFEYQRFSPNDRITDMIAATENNCRCLEDDDLFMVAAAGETDTQFGLDSDIADGNKKDENK